LPRATPGERAAVREYDNLSDRTKVAVCMQDAFGLVSASSRGSASPGEVPPGGLRREHQASVTTRCRIPGADRLASGVDAGPGELWCLIIAKCAVALSRTRVGSHTRSLTRHDLSVARCPRAMP
jgi:hypothetical protein